MKRFDARTTALLCLPLFLLGGGVVWVRVRAQNERKTIAAFYGQPLQSLLWAGRGSVPGYAGEGLWEAKVSCQSRGGLGQSKWLLRAHLFDISSKKPREIWNSDAKTQMARDVDLQPIMSGGGTIYFSATKLKRQSPFVSQPEMGSEYFWRFLHGQSARKTPFLLVVDGLNWSVPAQKRRDLQHGISIEIAPSLAEWKTAKTRIGAKILRTQLRLDGAEDKNWFYDRKGKPCKASACG